MFRSENEFQSAVAEMARRHALLHYHTHDSRRSESGFPDSVFVGRAVMFRELKLSGRSRVRPQQRAWIDALTGIGVDAGIWYAEDYYSGVVDEQLRDLTVRAGRRIAAGRRPPIAMRLAKRLYLAGVGADAGAKAALLWEAGVPSVGHDEWIAQAQHLLAAVCAELPTSDEEHLAWLTAHQLGAGAGAGAIFTALTSDLTARPTAGQLAAPGDC